MGSTTRKALSAQPRGDVLKELREQLAGAGVALPASARRLTFGTRIGGGLSHVRGQNGSDRQRTHRCFDDIERQTGTDAGDGQLQPPAAFLSLSQQGAAAVYLLGHVRKMEVGGEGANHLDRGRQIHVSQPRVDLRAQLVEATLLGPPANQLDQIQQGLAFTAHQRRAQQRRQQADVGAQHSVHDRVSRQRRHRHRSMVPLPPR